MSKLYDAIERLEQITEGEEKTAQETVPSIPPQPRPSSFIRRPLLFGSLVITIGCLVLVGVVWWQGSFVDLHSSSSDMHTAEVTASLPAPPSPASVTESDKVGAQEQDDPGKKVVPTPDVSGSAPAAASVSPGMNIALSSEMETDDRSGGQPENPVDSNSRNQTMVVEPQPLSSVPVEDPAAARQRKETTLTRLLLQAEQRRRDQDWQGAVLLYRQVWKASANPAVANNLAAALLKLHKNKQAIEILHAALVVSPDDQDLLNNLRLARRKER